MSLQYDTSSDYKKIDELLFQFTEIQNRNSNFYWQVNDLFETKGLRNCQFKFQLVEMRMQMDSIKLILERISQLLKEISVSGSKAMQENMVSIPDTEGRLPITESTREYMRSQGLLKLDFGAFFIWSSIMLDHWAFSFAHLAGLPRLDRTFNQFANDLTTRPKNQQLTILWNRLGPEILSISASLTLFRTKYYVHDVELVSKGLKFDHRMGYVICKYGSGKLPREKKVFLEEIVASQSNIDEIPGLTNIQRALERSAHLDFRTRKEVIEIAKEHGGYQIQFRSFAEQVCNFMGRVTEVHYELLTNFPSAILPGKILH